MRQLYRAALAVAAVALLAGGASAADPGAPRVAAGIEIGHRGCRIAVVAVEPTPWKSTDVRVRYEKTVFTPLGTGLAETGKLNDDDVKKTVAEVVRLCELASTELGVPDEQIHIATAASLDGATGLSELCAAVRAATKRPVTNVTAAREVLYGMRQLMPAEYMKGAWYADLGSGKLKLGTYVAGGRAAFPELRTTETDGLAGTYARIAAHAAKIGKPFAEAASAVGDELVKEFEREARVNPALANRTDVILTGGAVWALVTLVKPEEATAAYVKVTAADIVAFEKALRAAGDKFPAADLSRVKWEVVRKAAEHDLAAVRDRFTVEQLLAGAQLLRGMSEGLKLSGKDAYFPRNGGAAWIATFAVEQLTGKPVVLN